MSVMYRCVQELPAPKQMKQGENDQAGCPLALITRVTHIMWACMFVHLHATTFGDNYSTDPHRENGSAIRGLLPPSECLWQVQVAELTRGSSAQDDRAVDGPFAGTPELC